MDQTHLRSLLEEVQSGAVGVDAALDRLRHLPFEDLGFAKVDHHRALRHGMPEVIFGKGKTPEQMVEIASRLLDRAPFDGPITLWVGDGSGGVTRAVGPALAAQVFVESLGAE